MEIKTFVFNMLEVNTYVLFDETKECIIIDPACEKPAEEKKLFEFISENNLIPKAIYNTHCHIDHIFGNKFISEKFNIPIIIHHKGKELIESVGGYASMLGVSFNNIFVPSDYIEEGNKIKFGNTELEVIYTPGHADGSVCYINKKDKVVFTGDILFNGSIGRSDLPTGDYETLINSINNKLMVLDDDYIVYCGHGPTTSIGFEKKHNPYL